jgi:hypothetical protein
MRPGARLPKRVDTGPKGPLGDAGVVDDGRGGSLPTFAVVTFGEVGGVLPEGVEPAAVDGVGSLGAFVPTVPGTLVSGALFATLGLDDAPFA